MIPVVDASASPWARAAVLLEEARPHAPHILAYLRAHPDLVARMVAEAAIAVTDGDVGEAISCMREMARRCS